MTFTLYAGDLEPSLRVTLSDKNADVDVTDATAVRVIGRRDGTVAFTRTGTDLTLEHADGKSVVTMPWKTGDTATPGRIEIEIEVEWPGQRPQTFRPTNDVRVVDDLGGIA